MKDAAGELLRPYEVRTVKDVLDLPAWPGYEVAERAQRMRPDLKIILLSAAETDPHGWPLVRKPFLQSDLMRVVANIGKVC